MNRYKNLSVAVTGGTGFIGGRLAERLAFEEGARVNALVRSWNKARWICRADVNLIQGDLTRMDSLKPLVKDVDILFHCAMNFTEEESGPVNIDGTRNLIRVCAEQGVKRIVHFSTIGVHGPNIHDGMDEDAPIVKFGWSYSDTKAEGEKLFWQLIEEVNLEGVVIRPTYVWGPNSAGFTISPIKKMLKKTFALVDNGRGACNAVYVDNVVDLALIAGLEPRAAGESFLIRDPDRLTWGEFFTYYAGFINRDPAKFISVSSVESMGTKTARRFKTMTSAATRYLTEYVRKYESKWPKAVRYGLRAPRKALQIIEKRIDDVFPTPYGDWDLKKFSSPGHLSIDKAKNLLDFTPRLTTAEGMRCTRLWLKEQNYLE